jgi:hypothetical protein
MVVPSMQFCQLRRFVLCTTAFYLCTRGQKPMVRIRRSTFDGGTVVMTSGRNFIVSYCHCDVSFCYNSCILWFKHVITNYIFS